VYYVIRLVILYLGTILSPIVILLFLLPGFKAFAATAVKQYVTTIFILFVHVVILLLAATIFDGMQLQNAPGGSGTSSLMATVVGIATLVVLLKTQGLMQQWSYAVAGPNSMRKMGKQFNNGVRATMQKANPKAAAQEIPKVVILKTSTVKIREAK
jgi:hypothetical protein